ncbi:helix-turn-helix transcriptional regulator [Streptomyces deserti]
MSEGTAAADFAALLGELKERSGLSYGVLARRLHMSTSTLHRYCNGDAVPADYAPVERLARLCRATPEELVELHRRWVLADAVRGRKGAAGPSGAPVAVEPEASDAGTAMAELPVAPPAEAEAETETGVVVPAVAAPVPGKPDRHRRTRRRTAVVASIAVAAVLGVVTLAVSLPSGGADADGRRSSAGAAPSADGGGGEVLSASPSPSRKEAEPDSRKRDDKAGAADPSGSASARPTGRTGGGGGGGGSAAGADTHAEAAPLTVTTYPHDWEAPCGQHYLVNRPPSQVPAPPKEEDAPAWVAKAGAVPSGQQYVKLTVQGTGEETVVVQKLTVRLAGKRAPLAWNDYAMGYPGVGCGSSVPTRFFTVVLDAVRPGLVPEAGQETFPFKVSESEPEVFYIKADASAYDVSWYLGLSWTSGSRSGTVEIKDDGRPFRTSGNNGRPAYEFPLGGDKWVEEGTTS